MQSSDKYNQRVEKINSLLCVGLDPDFAKLPERFKSAGYPQFEFNKYIIDETAEFVVAYKLNIAFYESRGDQGVRELKMTMDYIAEKYPDIFTICDAKRGDIGNTNRHYATAVFDWLGADAITLQPYAGKESLLPFLARKDKISIILCRTSNPGAGELQDLLVSPPPHLPPQGGGREPISPPLRGGDKGKDGGMKPLWQIVVENVVKDWNGNNNCMIVMGATYPEEMKIARSIVGDMTFLVPGIGSQGGDIEATVRAGLNSQGRGMIINASRGIIFADDPKAAAKQLRDEINEYR